MKILLVYELIPEETKFYIFDQVSVRLIVGFSSNVNSEFSPGRVVRHEFRQRRKAKS
jgi:hypothetical protein